MMHDMAITESRSILMDLSVGYDFSMLEQGYRIPIRWQDARQSRLGAVQRLQCRHANQ
jgi:carotenoid cleavage dioxygenase